MAIKDLASKLVNKAKQTAVIGAGALGMYAGSVQDANAATMSLQDAVFDQNYVLLDLAITNNDNGAVYDSGIVDTSNLVSSLANHNDVSNSALTSDWIYDITGEVKSGWGATFQNNGETSLSTSAPFGNDIWRATQQDSTRDVMYLALGVPTGDLESNSILGYQPMSLADVQNGTAGDRDITIMSTANPDFLSIINHASYNGSLTPADATLTGGFNATTTGGFEIPATTNQYVAFQGSEFSSVPEPSSLALLGLGLGALAYRRSRKD